MMNFINNIGNKFLNELFPDGLNEKVLLGQLCLDLADQFSINIHVSQKPSKEIAKWGTWGKDYNVIVIKLIGQFLKKVNIVNWQNIDFCTLNFSSTNEYISLNFDGDTWKVNLEFKTLTFQRCDVYLKN
jgi:hypothetical protein